MSEHKPEKDPFEEKKRIYFSKLAMRMRGMLRLHKSEGLWDRVIKDGKPKRDWGNVSEHCLVEAARAEVFGELLGFPDDLRNDLTKAAALHDFFKKREREIARAAKTGGNDVVGSYSDAEKKAVSEMQGAGVDSRIIRLADSVGGTDEPMRETKRILDKEGELSEDDIAFLIMHYIDDYTIDSRWVSPIGEDSKNDLDRRIANNRIRYPEMPEALDEQERVGHLIENRLSAILATRGTSVEPLKIPEFIDDRIRERITASK